MQIIQGVYGYFKGFSAVTGRAVGANAIGFWAWETSKQHISLDKYFEEDY